MQKGKRKNARGVFGSRCFNSSTSADALCQFRVMDADEREIYQFLKSWGGQFVAAREICRRAGSKQRFQEEPEWAKPTLLRMAGRGILESDSTGHFRIKRLPKKHGDKGGTSPDSAKIAGESAEKAEDTGDVAPDEYYDQL